MIVTNRPTGQARSKSASAIRRNGAKNLFSILMLAAVICCATQSRANVHFSTLDKSASTAKDGNGSAHAENINLVAIPEPSTWGMLAVGAISLIVTQQKRRLAARGSMYPKASFKSRSI